MRTRIPEAPDEAADTTAATDFATHADPLDRDVSGPPSPGLRGWARWLWRRLTSMRTALILLLLLGIAAVPGSLIPQRTSDPMAVQQFTADNPALSQWYERVGLFDVYGTPWFAAIYLLLFISLVGCLLPRARQHWRMWRASPTPPPARPERLPASRRVPAADPTAALDAAEQHLRTTRWRVKRSPGWVAGEKGFVRETGNQIFHFALIGVLAAVGLGALRGWQGNVVLREGTGFSNILTQYDTFTGGRFADTSSLPPFSLRLDRFSVEFERGTAQRGAPREFDAAVTVTDATGEASATSLAVNEPIDVDGAKVYLLGHGYAPHVVVRDARGRVVFDDSVVFLPQDGNFTSAGVVKAPDAQPQLGLRGLFLPTVTVDPVRGPASLFPAPDDPALFLSAFTGDLGLDDGTTQSVYELTTDEMRQLGLKGLRVGETWRLPEGAGTVRFTGFDRWISVKVAHDPGGAWALGLVVVAIGGVCLSLFVKRRRVWVVAGDAAPSSVLVAGAGRGEAVGIEEDVASVAAALASLSPALSDSEPESESETAPDSEPAPDSASEPDPDPDPQRPLPKR